MNRLVFISHPTCPLCPGTLIKVAEVCEAQGLELISVTNGPENAHELEWVPGYPALVIPRGAFNTDKDIVMIGAEMPKQLTELIQQTK